MPYLTLPDGRLHYQRHEGAGPTLVFIHGLCCDRTDWRAQVAYFAAREQDTLCVDLRGHGESNSFAAGYDITHFGRDVAALLESLGIESSVLVGHSMGCRVALEVTSTAVHRVEGIALIDGSRFAAARGSEIRAAVFAQIEAAGGWAALVGHLFAEMFTEASDPAVRDAIVARAQAVPAKVGTGAFLGMNEWDAARMDAVLDGIEVPLLVVQTTAVALVGGRRRRVSLAADETSPWLDAVRERVAGARIEVLPGLGHFPQIEAPERVNEQLATLAAACSRQGTSE